MAIDLGLAPTRPTTIAVIGVRGRTRRKAARSMACCVRLASAGIIVGWTSFGQTPASPPPRPGVRRSRPPGCGVPRDSGRLLEFDTDAGAARRTEAIAYCLREAMKTIPASRDVEAAQLWKGRRGERIVTSHSYHWRVESRIRREAAPSSYRQQAVPFLPVPSSLSWCGW